MLLLTPLTHGPVEGRGVSLDSHVAVDRETPKTRPRRHAQPGTGRNDQSPILGPQVHFECRHFPYKCRRQKNVFADSAQAKFHFLLMKNNVAKRERRLLFHLIKCPHARWIENALDPPAIRDVKSFQSRSGADEVEKVLD